MMKERREMVTACCVHCGSISRVCCFLVGHATNLTWTRCRLFSCWFTRWATPWRMMNALRCQVVRTFGQLYGCGHLKDNKWRTVTVVWNLAVLSIRLSCTSASDVDDQINNDHVEQHCLLDNDVRTRDKQVRGMPNPPLLRWTTHQERVRRQRLRDLWINLPSPE